MVTEFLLSKEQMHKLCLCRGSGCGLVGRAVTSDTSDPTFESQHRQNFIYQLYIKKENTKIKIKIKRPNVAYIKKNCAYVKCLMVSSVFEPFVLGSYLNSFRWSKPVITSNFISFYIVYRFPTRSATVRSYTARISSPTAP